MIWKYLFFLTASLCVFATSAKAEPEQIDVIGFVPGVSTPSQVREFCQNTPTECVQESGSEIGGYFLVGGYKMPCRARFSNGYLSLFYCYFGKEYSFDMTNSSSSPFISNDKVFLTLVEGFRKKFGRETNSTDKTLRNRLGTGYTQTIVVWRDKKENYLIIRNIDGKVDEGSFSLISAHKMKEDEKEYEEKERQRKF